MKTKEPEPPDNPEFSAEEDLLQLQVTALEAAANPILISRRDGTIIWVNEAFEQLSGYPRAEAVGQNTNLLRSGQQPAAFYKTMWETILSGQRWRGELVNRRKDGRLYHEEMTITPVKGRTGDITHFIAIKLDITERKKTEERVFLLAQAVENSTEMIVIADSGGRISFTNQALLEATGFEESEIVGGLFGTAVLSQNDPPNLGHEIRLRTIFGGGWRGECFSRRKDGSDFPVFLSTGQIKDNQGQVVGVFGIGQDITERKRLEGQLIASQKMEAVGQLAGGIAHDFNNLLGVILGYADLLMEDLPATDPRWHKLEQIRGAGLRATSLTRQLLAFSRKQIFQPKVLDLNLLIVNLNKMLRRLVREDIDFLTALKPGIGNIKADPGQVEQVIMNLVVNSRDALPAGGKILIETANADLDEAYCQSHPPVQPGHYVMMAVSDTGVGMDPSIQAHIFEPFFTTKEQGMGTGLGLSTVYGIVKQSGGHLWVYSQAGMGTTFKIYFPRTDDPAQTWEAVRDTRKISLGSETILVAEDATDLRELTCALLKKNGYSVLAAKSSQEAIDLAESRDQAVHLLLTDVVMPGINGRELANRLAATYPAMKVLYMSGYTSNVIVHQGVLEAGISFIEKPFTELALMRKLREVLDRA